MPLLLLRKRGGPEIRISGNTVYDADGSGKVVGTLSVFGGSGVYTFSEVSDPDTKFQVVGDELQLSATVDYTVATSHQVTVQADNGVDPVITKLITVYVTLRIVYFIGIGAPAAAGEVTLPGAATFVIDDLGQFVIDDSANSIIVS